MEVTELKQGLTYISDRGSQFRYANESGKEQWVNPMSRYKALVAIERGQAVSIATIDDLREAATKPSTSEESDNVYAENRTLNEEYYKSLLEDPDPYVVPTNTLRHEKCIGLAMETVDAKEELHIMNIGKFDFDTNYEGLDGISEYNPKFTYDNVGKKVFVKYPTTDSTGKLLVGMLTVDEEEVYKYNHKIIQVGYLSDAPIAGATGQTITSIEINVQGDQRGPLDSTQFEVTLGEDMTINELDPVRFFALGKEEDTKFSAYVNLTPQGNKTALTEKDFIAVQKIDGKTAFIYFVDGKEGTFDVSSPDNYEDKSFCTIAQSYLEISENKESFDKNGCIKVSLNDTQNESSVISNISAIKSALVKAFNFVSGYDKDYVATSNEYTLTESDNDTSSVEFSNIKTSSDAKDFYGSFIMTSKSVGGYYTLYVSSGLQSKFDNTTTLASGSFENKGKAVLADIRIPTRREVIGVYCGGRYTDVEINKGNANPLVKGFTTIAMRMGQISIPKNCKQVGGFENGCEYYLGYNGRCVKYPYNQYDYVNKLAFVKDSDKLVVDVGKSTKHYNGDFPVGYMKPAVKVGTEFAAEYGFVLMDGTQKYSKSHPYDTLYTRLLGWFSQADVEIDDTTFIVPKVVRSMPDTENGGSIDIPMQIKYLASGIYEEVPRVAFKRSFGQFDKEQADSKDNNDYTPIKCKVQDVDITDIIDFGVNDNAYPTPDPDCLEIRLFADPNPDYVSGAHDWREIPEGFYNYNNTTTYGYHWIIERNSKATLNNPYGSFTLKMDVGESEGVAYVTDKNQAPIKLNSCYYKIYISRKETFPRQFDIEKIYMDYISNSVYSGENNDKVVVNKAVTGKAVIDAIANRYNMDAFTANTDATLIFGENGSLVKTLSLGTSGDLPIVSTKKIILKNSYTDGSGAYVVENGQLSKENLSNDASIYDISNGEFSVDDSIIPTAKQVREHHTLTIDGKDYKANYGNKSTSAGKIHGMVFGAGGNIDASTLGNIKVAKNSTAYVDKVDESLKSSAYIPYRYQTTDGTKWVTDNDGINIYYQKTKDSKIIEVSREEHTYNYDSSTKLTSIINTITIPASVNTSTVNSYTNKYIKSSGTGNIIETYNLDDNTLTLNGTSSVGTSAPTSIFAGSYTNASLSKYKRIYGENIRDKDLTKTALADGSLKYETNGIIKSFTDDQYVVENAVNYEVLGDTNKFNTILGSALQAAYEMPLAYWQYNTEKEWYKDTIGVIVERVNDVAQNLTGKEYATGRIYNLEMTAKEPGAYGNNYKVTVESRNSETNSPNDYRLTIYDTKTSSNVWIANITQVTDSTTGKTTVSFPDTDKDGTKNTFITFEDYGTLKEGSVQLSGGKDSVERNIIESPTEYIDNKNTIEHRNSFIYTQKEAESIREYLKSVIDNSSRGQNITSSVGLLFKAAKEAQERLIKLEASTFGRDYEEIPGGMDKFNIVGMPHVIPEPTTYGLNRLIRAICMELYNTADPFDSKSLNNKDGTTTSLSRIDNLDKEIHGQTESNDNTTFSNNDILGISSTTYPYDDNVYSKADIALRAKASYDESTDKDIKDKGTNVKTRISMKGGDSDANIFTDANKQIKFNGITDAIYRITTKLNALTESVNNEDNIMNTPVRLNTIRSNIEHIINEAYLEDKDGFTKSVVDLGKTTGRSSGIEFKRKNNERFGTQFIDGFDFTVSPAGKYADISGATNTPYTNTDSRLDRLTKDLYEYSIDTTIPNISVDFEFGTIYPVNKNINESVQNITNYYYYTGRLFNGKSLLLEKSPDGTDSNFIAKFHTPDNLSEYDFANIIDVMLDSIGDEVFRKNTALNINYTDGANNALTRHNETLSARLDNIESTLDKLTHKISRQRSFEEETDINKNLEDITNKSGSENLVYSVDRYLDFLNEYFGYYQTTTDDFDNKSVNRIATYTNNWVAGVGGDTDSKLDTLLNTKDYNLTDTKVTAEWAVANRKSMHGGIVNMLYRLQNEEAKSDKYDALLGADFNSSAKNVTITTSGFNNDTNLIQTYKVASTYNLTDDIKDLLKTIYGFDSDTKDNTTGFTHRTLVTNSNINDRFVSFTDINNPQPKNIIDLMVEEMYYLPRPIKIDSTGSITETGSSASHSDFSEDSRSATHYDFDTGTYMWDIPGTQSAINNQRRFEFFNDIATGFKDDIIEKNKTTGHHRYSRFEVIENELRNLRKLLGLSDVNARNNTTDEKLQASKLEFNCDLEYTGKLYTAAHGIESTTHFAGYNFDSSDSGSTDYRDSGTTNILKTIINNDRAIRRLRNELGYTNEGKVTKDKFSKYPTENAINSNFNVALDTYYDPSSYYIQNQSGLADGTWNKIYDRISVLEQQMTVIDQWADSIKNIDNDNNGLKTGTGNIYDIVNYLGGYTWSQSSKVLTGDSLDYFGKFGNLDYENLKITNRQATTKYSSITEELNGHHAALINIYDTIGTDNKLIATDKTTLWERLNAVESLNQNDLDITNVIAATGPALGKVIGTEESDTVSSVMLTTSSTIGTTTDSGNTIAAKSYVDYSANALKNWVAKNYTSNPENITVNVSDTSPTIVDKYNNTTYNTSNLDSSLAVAKNGTSTAEQEKDKLQDDTTVSGVTLTNLIDAINLMSKDLQDKDNTLYTGLLSAAKMLGLDDISAFDKYRDTGATTGSLLNEL